ncbi:hypothetical protein QBC38DRAFT_487796 [Podospora fimiseda]|uniref:NTF2-like domain-containing protein n=1 Tax=Podospora fimiseda TaxID=252190 RepID=A0AAN7GSB8_9PEZI|nr:hypothetical protein QBC38DRAFT_487796 [Podospora fimiseda]
MRFLTLLSLSTGLVAAAPNPGFPFPGVTTKSKGTCLWPSDVKTLVDAYVRMLTKWNDADAVYLASDFVDNSDSINQLAGIPLGTPTFPSKEAFIEHQHVQPDNLPITVTHSSPTDCDEIALIWTVKFGIAQKQVRGITILGAIKEDGDWKIKSIDVEFNNIAYLLNIGGSFLFPGQACPA